MGFFSDLFGGGSQPSELTRTVTSQAAIPGFLRPFVEQAAGTGESALSALSQAVNAGGLTAPFSADQLLAQALGRELATGAGSPLATATQTLSDTAAGEGFGSSAFADAFNALVRRAQPGVISPFIAAGRGTGGLADAALGQAQADAFASLFNAERSRQQQAAQALPSIALAPFNLLSGIGGQQQQQAQAEISAPIAAQQGLLGAALGGLPVSGLIGQTQTATQPLYNNRAAGALGTGLLGLGLLRGIGNAGGITGLLGGLF